MPKVSEKQLVFIVLGLILAIGLVMRLNLAFFDQGIYWPDEIYQSIEPAHHLAFGYGMLPWEYQDGARSWLFPAALAGVMKFTKLTVGDDPANYLLAIRLLFIFASLAVAFGVYRFACYRGVSRWAALSGVAFIMLSELTIFFSNRALTENASAFLIFMAFFSVASPQPSKKRLLLGILWMGLSFFLRLQNLLIGVGFVIWIWQLYGRKSAFQAGVGLLGIFFLLGFSDLMTWGSAFHTVLTYLKFNLVENYAAQFGVVGFEYYFVTLGSALGWLSVIVLVLICLAGFRQPVLLLTVAFYFFIHTLIPHKELRFMLPLVPLVAVLICFGMDQIIQRLSSWPWNWSIPVIFIMALALTLLRFPQLTFADIGLANFRPAEKSAYDSFGAVNRLLLQAYHLPDLCGLKIEELGVLNTGGYSYLHRPVAFFDSTGPAFESQAFNYLIAKQLSDFPSMMNAPKLVAAEGSYHLWKLYSGPCQSDYRQTQKLPESFSRIKKQP
jgi:hypothetical protein